MRKHASSWGIKALLAMIIVSFVLFFGYSSITRMKRAGVRGSGGGEAVATVNHVGIPASEYKFYLDTTLEHLRAQFKDQPVPDFMRTMAEQQALGQVIQRELKLQMADQLNIRIPDDELADAIKQQQTAMRGSFDPIFYKQQYLPYFEQRFGIEFESLLRNDLRADRAQQLFIATPPVPAKAEGKNPPPATEKVTQWSFEIVTLDTDAMIKANTVATQDEAKKAAEEFVTTAPAQWKTLAKKYGADIARVDGATLEERAAKLPGYAFEDYTALFSLATNAPVLAKPIARNDNKFAVVRLVSREETDKDAPALTGDFFRQWMTQVAARAKIHTFLDDQQAKKK